MLLPCLLAQFVSLDMLHCLSSFQSLCTNWHLSG